MNDINEMYNSGSKSQNNAIKYSGMAVIAVLIFVAGVILGRSVDGSSGISGILDGSSFDSSSVSADVDFDLYWTVWQTVAGRFVDEDVVNEDTMLYDSIKGMVSALGDPHTVYLDPDETEAFNSSSAGNYFSGIGAELGYEDGLMVVISPLKGSPAIDAGVRPGDVILAVDGEAFTADDTVFDAVAKIRGERGTKVVLTVLHKGDSTPVDITIVRDEITVPSMDVTINEDEKVAVIEVSRFTDSSLSVWQSNWDKAVDAVLESDAEGVIIDLRGNPGGYMDAAIYAAGEFLPEGSIVLQQEDRQGHVRDHTVLREGRLLDMEVVVLVNGASASSSEILAGALQKNDRATVVGMDSFGKGTAQEIVEFADGSSLHVTVIKWLLPDGTWISEDNKIVPDKKVDLTDEDFKEGNDPQMDAAIALF